MNREAMRHYLLGRGYELRSLKDSDILTKEKTTGVLRYTLMNMSWKLEQKREVKEKFR